MAEKISPFVRQIRPWIIRKTLVEYLHARNMFNHLKRKNRRDEAVTFEDLKKLSNVLYKVKEDLYLVFRRVLNPQTREFEKVDKYKPTDAEIEFINNVAVVFHKVMVARELKYVMEHYATESQDYSETKSSYDSYWEKVEAFFADGLELLKTILAEYGDIDSILWYLLINERHLSKSLGEKITDVLKKSKYPELDTAYLQAGEYCLKSGWRDRAEKLLHEALAYNSNNEQAKNLLQKLRHVA
ncbi:hypothetical protein JW992_02465 [candidate division KSB1 bacterium]|nr:hypothetical protein [candidate division KSB1 bacterium]